MHLSVNTALMLRTMVPWSPPPAFLIYGQLAKKILRDLDWSWLDIPWKWPTITKNPGKIWMKQNRQYKLLAEKTMIERVASCHKLSSEGRGEFERCDPLLNMSRWSGAEAGNVMLPHSTCMQIASVCTRHNTTGASSNKQGLIERCNWIMSNATSHNMYTHNLTNNIHSLRGKEAIYY